MSKLVNEFDVIFDESEVEFIRTSHIALIRSMARNHFTLNEGMTEEEINERVEFDDPIIVHALTEMSDGTVNDFISAIVVPVTVKAKLSNQ